MQQDAVRRDELAKQQSEIMTHQAELITRLQQQNEASASQQVPPPARPPLPEKAPAIHDVPPNTQNTVPTIQTLQEDTSLPTGPTPPPIPPQLSKVRFAPKGPPRRVQKPVVPKIEKTETIDADAQAQELLRRFNEASGKVKPKVEKKVASTQIAFGYGGQSNSIKSYGSLKGGIGVNNDGGGGAYSSVLGDQKEYKEPWDYYSYYPITLPLRRPYSGNPELLNEEEFREASENVTYDEHSIRPANDLGLQEENLEASIFFLQLPANMPMVKQSANAEGQEMVNNSEPPKSAGPSKKGCSLDELPGGFMGKMLVYKSGAVKLKLGDIIYDVSAGSDSEFAQDVVAINTEEKHCCVVGELSQRAVITPDVDSILNSISDL
ncbi:hypothetical protein TEA_029247 [Camellia sinensis var. sinensis]|uniref:DNA-directed RNA polymerase III subunit RPC4 n=1 Tax=Camellia sinensis var. sinensis TaxID=542762 RepID=A0A4S4DN52_CAMSN|nr:hypothetical protein TEA_029247 [Camellia sinensis var. sinensis]